MDDKIDAYLAKSREALRKVGEAEIALQAKKVGDTLEAWAMANAETSRRRIVDTHENRQGGLFSGSSLRRWVGYGVIAAAVLISIPAIKYARDHILPSPTVVTKSHITASAQRAKITLPDGSSVLLAPESRITYASDFGKNSRTINLEGEALFTVVKDGYPPFIVNAENTATRVLGTTFGVRAYDKTVRIVVAEGRVSVASHTLSIANVATVTGSKVQIQRNAPIADYLAWTTGRLVFRDTELNEVVIAFRRMYGVNIQLGNPVLGTRLVTTSIGDMPTVDAVNMLAGIVGLRAERSGSVIQLME